MVTKSVWGLNGAGGPDDGLVTELARVPGGGLKPLSTDLSPEVFAWATELRGLFAGTGLSISRFVLLYEAIDKGTVSRYLNGKRVPRDRWFLDTLMAAQADVGKPLTPDSCERLIRLQLSALAAAHPHEYRVRQVIDELETAIIRQREAERYARGLEEELAERVQQVERLAAARVRLHAVRVRERRRMRADLHRLNQEITDLRERLRVARERSVQAEDRCRQLEELFQQLASYVLTDDSEFGHLSDIAARVLHLAQQTADQTIAEARQEAGDALKRAKREAAEILNRARATTADEARP